MRSENKEQKQPSWLKARESVLHTSRDSRAPWAFYRSHPASAETRLASLRPSVHVRLARPRGYVALTSFNAIRRPPVHHGVLVPVSDVVARDRVSSMFSWVRAFWRSFHPRHDLEMSMQTAFAAIPRSAPDGLIRPRLSTPFAFLMSAVKSGGEAGPGAS